MKPIRFEAKGEQQHGPWILVDHGRFFNIFQPFPFVKVKSFWTLGVDPAAVAASIVLLQAWCLVKPTPNDWVAGLQSFLGP